MHKNSKSIKFHFKFKMQITKGLIKMQYKTLSINKKKIKIISPHIIPILYNNIFNKAKFILCIL